MNQIFKKSLILASVFLASAPAFAGYYVKSEIVIPNPQTGKPLKGTTEMWREGKKIKQTAPLREDIIVIDGDKREVVGFNKVAKTYWKMPFDRYQKMAQTQLVAVGIIPNPDGSFKVPKKLFEPTKQKATISGKNAYETKVKASIKLPPQMVQAGQPSSIETIIAVWLTEELPLTEKDRVDEMRLQLGDPKDPEFENLFVVLGKSKGYPVQTTTTVKAPTGEIQSSSTLLTFSEQALSDKDFAVPEGFSLVEDPITQLERAMQQPAGLQGPLKAAPAPAPAQAN
jgi:hypothetical protein